MADGGGGSYAQLVALERTVDRLSGGLDRLGDRVTSLDARCGKLEATQPDVVAERLRNVESAVDGLKKSVENSRVAVQRAMIGFAVTVASGVSIAWILSGGHHP